MSSVLERMKARMPLRGKPENRPHHLNVEIADRDILNRQRRMEAITEAMAKQLKSRRLHIVDYSVEPLVAHHNKKEDGTCNTYCPGCSVQKRAADGKTVMRYLVLFDIDHATDRHEVPRKRVHDPRRSGHKRIQKKWDAQDKGKTMVVPVRNQEYWVFTEMQFHMLQRSYFRLGGLNAPHLKGR